tara:strand:+ start:1678 stop:1890 length:213 start_codon:yes stop_codon:yes gene_type:complete
MFLDSLNLNGYGQFVWPAYIFTFFTISIFYLKTRRELKRIEKLYFSKFGDEKVKESKIKERLPASTITAS